MTQTSLLVQTLTAATNSFPIDHIESCVGCLGFTLKHAGFENVHVSDVDAFGCALECDRDNQHHVVLATILPADLYELTDSELQDIVQTLIENDDHLDDLVRALDGAVLDVASVCFDPINGRCRIHHPQDVLHTGAIDHERVHFFIPAGGDTPVPAEDWDDDVMGSPLALSRVLATA